MADLNEAELQVWVVTASQGEYSDRSEWPVSVHTSEAEGQAEVERLDAADREKMNALPQDQMDMTTHYLSGPFPLSHPAPEADRIGTHYDGCWLSGPRHYDCATRRISELEAEVARRDAVAAAKWGDQEDQWSGVINAEHPVNGKDPERFRRFDTALEMIGTRHGKYELVGMAAWLIARAKRAEAKLATAVEALDGVEDDYMTSETHHPRHVLIPVDKFERLRQALASIQERT